MRKNWDQGNHLTFFHVGQNLVRSVNNELGSEFHKLTVTDALLDGIDDHVLPIFSFIYQNWQE